MKILWVCPFFLHPTDRGAQIRTLGTLKELARRHEIHFAALNDPTNVEGPSRASEYSSSSISVEHAAPRRGSFGIVPQLLTSLWNPVPLAVSRYDSPELKRRIKQLIATENYNSIVCDFLASAPNIPNLGQSVLFQHNVESTIWQRHAAQAGSAVKRLYFRMQARKMLAYEAGVCRQARHVIAVSDIDAARIRNMFGTDQVTSVPTGVDVDYFAAPDESARLADMIFCGSMDWLPNVDAVLYFIAEVWPLIRTQIPQATFMIAGRSPDAKVLKAAEGMPGITVTGKVDDMRPYLWGAQISVVPIRIGGGTRLKIYECMAAGVPVVSTSVGAEGLRYTPGQDIVIADEPEAFAAACVRLIIDEGERKRIAATALRLVEAKLSWSAVSRDFEAILESSRLSHTVAGPA